MIWGFTAASTSLLKGNYPIPGLRPASGITAEDGSKDEEGNGA